MTASRRRLFSGLDELIESNPLRLGVTSVASAFVKSFQTSHPSYIYILSFYVKKGVKIMFLVALVGMESFQTSPTQIETNFSMSDPTNWIHKQSNKGGRPAEDRGFATTG
ncbi:hypothetical protein J6590_038898 [Homalodisca vitripennis]|nr:hypothetical protein J6590_038898 [Homalodisca vitripennis]